VNRGKRLGDSTWLTASLLRSIIHFNCEGEFQGMAQPVCPNSFASLLGTLIGGLVALTSIWVKNRFDEKAQTQKWFEDEYLFGAVEPLYTALETMWLSVVIESPTKAPLLTIDRDTVAMVGRVGQILQSDAFLRLFAMTVAHLQRNEPQPAVILVRGGPGVPGLSHILHRLSEVLLEQQIRQKTDALQLANKAPVRSIVERLEALDRLYEKAVSSEFSKSS